MKIFFFKIITFIIAIINYAEFKKNCFAVLNIMENHYKIAIAVTHHRELSSRRVFNEQHVSYDRYGIAERVAYGVVQIRLCKLH